MEASNLIELGLIAIVGFILPTFPFLPIRLIVLIPLAATHIHPMIVTLVAAISTALGTLPLYAVGRSAVSTRTVETWLQRPGIRRFMGWLQGKMFIAAFAFAVLPLPDQLMSLIGGAHRYSAFRFWLAFFLGRIPYFLILAYLGATHRESLNAASAWVIRLIGL